jgi:2-C-methyl-D-erythritol 4-phosphate cytidylyltransferase
MTAAAIIVAAGKGQRFGDPGKSFVPVLGKPMAGWSLQAAAAACSIDEIVLVCGEHSHAAATALLQRIRIAKSVRLVLGGARRQDSALAGIRAASGDVDVVAIHDAARPLVTSSLFDAAVAAASLYGAAIAAVPVSDTIKRVVGDLVVETIPRDSLVNVQTPQAFRKALLLDVFAEAEKVGRSATDEASLVEAAGGVVWVVPGFPENLKVTHPADIVLVEALLRARHE